MVAETHDEEEGLTRQEEPRGVEVEGEDRQDENEEGGDPEGRAPDEVGAKGKQARSEAQGKSP